MWQEVRTLTSIKWDLHKIKNIYGFGWNEIKPDSFNSRVCASLTFNMNYTWEMMLRLLAGYILYGEATLLY